MLKISSSRNKTDLGEGEAPEDPEITRLADVSIRDLMAQRKTYVKKILAREQGPWLQFIHSNNTY